MVSVLVVHSSNVGRDRLVRLLSEDREFHVDAAVANTMEALAILSRKRPDVVMMEAAHRNELDAVRRIMETTPVPIVAVANAGRNADGLTESQWLDAGAVAVVNPPSDSDTAHRRGVKQTVKAMAGIKVVRRWPRNRERPRPLPPLEPAVARPGQALSLPAGAGMDVVAIGVSTGGPPALQTVLSRLPNSFDAPILIVQHIARGFVQGLADWLNQMTELDVRLANHGEVVRSGCVYLAPDDFHMGIDRDRRIVLDGGAPEYGMRPAVSHLFRSVAQSFGSSAVGILMTGMGRDGAQELKILHDAGAVTMAQEKESCVVFGMSAEAIRLGAARLVLSPEQIGVALSTIAASLPNGREAVEAALSAQYFRNPRVEAPNR